MIIPMMLPMVNLMVRPKVRIRTPRFSVSGFASPKFRPKFSQDRPGTPLASWLMKLPRTTPAKISRNSAHPFFPAPRAISMYLLYLVMFYATAYTILTKTAIHSRKKVLFPVMDTGLDTGWIRDFDKFFSQKKENPFLCCIFLV